MSEVLFYIILVPAAVVLGLGLAAATGLAVFVLGAAIWALVEGDKK